VKANGGGDRPEDVRGGLKKALDIHFKSNVKIITHIADAPCHGQKYNKAQEVDSYPKEGDDSNDPNNVEALIKQLFAKERNL